MRGLDSSLCLGDGALVSRLINLLLMGHLEKDTVLPRPSGLNRGTSPLTTQLVHPIALTPFFKKKAKLFLELASAAISFKALFIQEQLIMVRAVCRLL